MKFLGEIREDNIPGLIHPNPLDLIKGLGKTAEELKKRGCAA